MNKVTESKSSWLVTLHQSHQTSYNTSGQLTQQLYQISFNLHSSHVAFRPLAGIHYCIQCTHPSAMSHTDLFFFFLRRNHICIFCRNASLVWLAFTKLVKKNNHPEHPALRAKGTCCVFISKMMKEFLWLLQKAQRRQSPVLLSFLTNSSFSAS